MWQFVSGSLWCPSIWVSIPRLSLLCKPCPVAACGPDATWGCCIWRDCGSIVQVYRPQAFTCDWMLSLHHRHSHADAESPCWRIVLWMIPIGCRYWELPSVCPVTCPSMQFSDFHFRSRYQCLSKRMRSEYRHVILTQCRNAHLRQAARLSGIVLPGWHSLGYRADEMTLRSPGNDVVVVVATFCVKLSGIQQYQVPLAVNIPLPAIIFMAIFLLLESPRWLLLRNQDEKAMRSLQRIRHPLQQITYIKDKLLEIKAAITKEKRHAIDSALRDVIRNPVDRRKTTLSVVVELTESNQSQLEEQYVSPLEYIPLDLYSFSHFAAT